MISTFLAAQVAQHFNLEKILERLLDFGIDVGQRLIGAVLIYVIGRFIIKQLNKLLSKLLERRKLEVSVQTFLKSLTSLLLNLILAFAIVAKLGV